jgi:hypothetical protein
VTTTYKSERVLIKVLLSPKYSASFVRFIHDPRGFDTVDGVPIDLSMVPSLPTDRPHYFPDLKPFII